MPPRSTNEEDEASKIQKPKVPAQITKRQRREAAQQQRRDDARQTMLDETQAEDDLDVKALAAFYEQDDRYLADDGMLYLAGVIERDGSDKASEHLEDAREMFGGWIDRERRVRRLTTNVGDWLRKVHPKMSNPDKILSALADVARAGVDNNTLIDAVNSVHNGRNANSYRHYLAAIEAVTPAKAAA